MVPVWWSELTGTCCRTGVQPDGVAGRWIGSAQVVERGADRRAGRVDEDATVGALADVIVTTAGVTAAPRREEMREGVGVHGFHALNGTDDRHRRQL